MRVLFFVFLKEINFLFTYMDGSFDYLTSWDVKKIDLLSISFISLLLNG